jgi:hypothetical protein
MPAFNAGYKSPRAKPYRAYLNINGERKFLGSYRNREEARQVEIEAKKQYLDEREKVK